MPLLNTSRKRKSQLEALWCSLNERSCTTTRLENRFRTLLGQITDIGLEHHRETILENSRRNAPHIQKTLRDVRPTALPVCVVSAGPSLYRRQLLQRIRDHQFAGTIVATDGAYLQCLRAGITPDYVVTIDPHPTRIVRWFGDPDLAENTKGDDYFQRQDLDMAARGASVVTNNANIDLVNAHPAKLVIATSAASNVVARTSEFERYWFCPLVDGCEDGSITQQMVAATGAPALNTGGTVGTAAWAYAHCILGATNIAVVGMDYGYPAGTPLTNTQEWNLLKEHQDVEDFYPAITGPWGECYTSPTYYWYRQNFFDLLEAADARITNCTEGGILFGPRVDCKSIEEWLAQHK